MSNPPVYVTRDGSQYNYQTGLLMQTFAIQEENQDDDGDDDTGDINVRNTLCQWLKNHLSDGRTFARGIFITLCLIFTSISVIRSTLAYFEYETGVSVQFEELNHLRESLPGLTICNKNLISKEEALKEENVPGLEMSLRYLQESIRKVSNSTASFADRKADQKKREIEIWEDYMSVYYGKLPVMRQVKHGPKLDQFLIHLRCNQKGWPDLDHLIKKMIPSSYECQNSKWINTAQGKGNCITLFHAATWNASQGVNQIGSSSVKEPPTARDRKFVPLEVIKMMFDFGPQNYTDLRLEAGGELMFHDNRTIPLEASLSYTLRPGTSYRFHLKKTITRSLEAPFASNCTNYFANHWHEYSGDDETSIRTKNPLSRTHCIELCVIERITRENKCWPKEIPFLAKGEPKQMKDNKTDGDNSDEGILWCHRQNLKRHEREEVYHKFVRANRRCSDICGKDCLRDYFETIFQGIDWPSRESIAVTDSSEERRKLQQIHDSCAFVSVLYSSRMVQVNQLYARTELVDFLSEVGGSISMWIGISALSSYTLAVLVIDSSCRTSRNRIP